MSTVGNCGRTTDPDLSTIPAASRKSPIGARPCTLYAVQLADCGELRAVMRDNKTYNANE